MAVVLEPLPPKEAIAAFEKRRQLQPTFDWRDAWQQEHATMFTVAKSAGFDVLEDIRQSVETALAEGRTLRDFSKELQPLLVEKGWWGRDSVVDPATGEAKEVQLGSPRRLQTIFDTNMRVSYASGHWAQIQATKASRPYLRYVAILDGRTRPAHRARHNVCLPVDDPWWDLWAPPCGWKCRCTLQSLSERDFDRMKGELKLTPPPDTFKNWLNKRTGETLRVADGIDPGWGYNPGKAGFQAAPIADKLIPAAPQLAAAAAADKSWPADKLTQEFSAWFAQAAAGKPTDRSMMAIGALDADVLKFLGAKLEPKSGAITVDRLVVAPMLRELKKATGDAAPDALLARLPSILREPKAILWDKRGGELLYVFDPPGADASLGKLVVRVGVAGKAPPGAAGVATNAVQSAAFVAPPELADPAAYRLVSGSL